MDPLRQMIDDAYAWAARNKAFLSVNGFSEPTGVRAAKREAIRRALLIPGISQRGVAELTGCCMATVSKVAVEQKRLARRAVA